jgi:NADH-quinone oxidoreductase subunit G
MRIARAPHRDSGRTAITAARSVHEPGVAVDTDAPLSFSMEGYQGTAAPALTPFVWAPGWNSNAAVNKFQEEIAGSLRGSNPGVRLFTPASREARSFSCEIPAGFQPRAGHWLLVPLYHIFGSEELSAYGEAVAERMPSPYLALAAYDAAALGVEVGDVVRLECNGSAWRLAVHIHPQLAGGSAGLPVGLPGLAAVELPAWGVVYPERSSG